MKSQCSGLNGELPKRYVHSEHVNVTLFGKRVFTDVVKDLKMRSSWFNQMSPKSNGTRLYKRREHKTH